MRLQRNIVFLSFAFLLIFFGFDGLQQYITISFTQQGFKELGFVSLIIIYSVFTLANPIAAMVVSRLGAKRSMMIAALFYTLYCLSLLSLRAELIVGASVLLGIAGALLWTAQTSYLVRASEPAVYGRNSGLFPTFFAIGAAGGVFVFGWILPMVGFEKSFFLFALFPLIAIILLLGLEDIRTQVQGTKWATVFGIARSKTALRFAAIWFPFNFIQGLVLGALPLEISQIMGSLRAVGVLTALFYISPIVLSYSIGRLSDKIGRRSMITLMYASALTGLGLLVVRSTPVFLVVAIVILAFNFGLFHTIGFALVGDVSTQKTLESFTALTWMVRSSAFVPALLFGAVLEHKQVTIASLLSIVFSYFIFWKIRKLSFPAIQSQIEQEVQ
ncbi:MFS transporter [Candidatus Uhrbacteria bacterium]|nr:MFS transporter [Candidatus Uhrbacteria bacterium]